jgi:two-component system response regulator AtoC
VKPVLLIVDDEESVRESFRQVLQNDYDLVFAEDAKSTLRLLKTQTFNLCLLDIMLPDGSGLDLLRQMKRRDESIDVIMVTALQGVQTGLDAMKGKAKDYITKPFQIDELRGLIKKTLAKRSLEKEVPPSYELKPLCLTGTSRRIQELIKKMKKMVSSARPLCLVGERGSGVEEIAREIHSKSQRAQGPFVTLNCSLPEALLERELFGGETEGRLPQVGKLEFADKGTLFLKQIDRLPLGIQEKLLEVLPGKTLRSQESATRLKLDIRLIGSSDVKLAVPHSKRFFTKNFYRFLTQSIVSVPPLRERKIDIPLLMSRVIETVPGKTSVQMFEKEALHLLIRYPWPGNVTELESTLKTMVFFAGKDTLTLDDIPFDILIQQMNMGESKKAFKISVKQLQRQFERIYIRKSLERNRGNQSRVAKELGLHRNTLIDKIKQLNLENDIKKMIQKRRLKDMPLRHV